MKRLFRWAFNFAAAMSAVLCVAVAGAWVFTRYDQSAYEVSLSRLRGYSILWNGEFGNATLRDDTVEVNNGRIEWHTETISGIWVRLSHPWKCSAAEGLDWNYGIGQRRTQDWHRWDILGWEVGRFQSSIGRIPAVWGWEMKVPCSFLVPLLALLPSLWLVRKRAAARLLSGEGQHLCPSCGYDLRATPGRCPECGARPSGKGGRHEASFDSLVNRSGRAGARLLVGLGLAWVLAAVPSWSPAYQGNARMCQARGVHRKD